MNDCVAGALTIYLVGVPVFTALGVALTTERCVQRMDLKLDSRTLVVTRFALFWPFALVMFCVYLVQSIREYREKRS